MAVTPTTVPRKATLPSPTTASKWTEWFRSLPFGGAVGVVGAGLVLRFLPGVVPEAWDATAVLALGMGLGLVLHRVVDWLFGWFLEPMRRHLFARWEAWLRLTKLERYARRGFIARKEADTIASGIARADIAGQVEPGTTGTSRRRAS